MPVDDVVLTVAVDDVELYDEFVPLFPVIGIALDGEERPGGDVCKAAVYWKAQRTDRYSTAVDLCKLFV